MEAAEKWLYISYDFRGGDIDFVYGMVRDCDRVFGPIEEPKIAAVKSAYLLLMGAYDISEADAMKFAPFEPGYWDDA